MVLGWEPGELCVLDVAEGVVECSGGMVAPAGSIEGARSLVSHMEGSRSSTIGACVVAEKTTVCTSHEYASTTVRHTDGVGVRCWLDACGEAQCDETSQEYADALDGPFVDLGLLWGGLCGLTDAGAVDCYRWTAGLGIDEMPTFDVPAVEYFSSSAYEGCVIYDSGFAECWGLVGGGEYPAALQPYQWVDTEFRTLCLVRSDGELECLVSDSSREPPRPFAAPPGQFREVATGENWACGRRPDRDVVCFSGRDLGSESDWPELPAGASWWVP